MPTVNKITVPTVLTNEETIRHCEAQLRYYESRQAEHAKNVDKLLASVAAAEKAVQDEYEYIAGIPAKRLHVENQIRVARQQIEGVKVAPAVRRLERIHTRMAAMLADLSTEEREELTRMASSSVAAE